MVDVAVVGASANEERYSNQAMRMLAEKGHNPVPVAPARGEILGRKVCASLADVPGPVDTVTMYVGAARQAPVIEEVLHRKPRRVIFNPGAENPAAYPGLRAAGIEVVEACTLVLLRTGRF